MSEEQPQHPEAPQSENAISDYYEGVKKLEMEGYQTGIKKARAALFVTAALVFIGEMVSTGVAGIPFTPLIIGIALLEAGVFVALAFWTKTKPYTAIIVGLILFLLMWVAAVAINGVKGAYSGIIVRIIIIVNLVNALKPAKAWEETKKK